MRQIVRFQFVLLLLFSSGRMVVAAELPPRYPPKQDLFEAASAIAPENGESIAPDDLPKELEAIVNSWEKKSATIKTLCGTYTKSEFNHTFETERVSTGRFFMESPHRWRIDERSIKIKTGAVSKRKSRNGEAYSLESNRPDGWIVTEDALVWFQEDEKTFQKADIPKELRETSNVQCPLQFLFFIKAKEAKQRFRLSRFHETNEAVVLWGDNRKEMAPRQFTFHWDFFNFGSTDPWKNAAIILDKETSLPTRIRLVDHSNIELIYTFDQIDINRLDELNGAPPEDCDIFSVTSLKGYREFISPPPPEAKRPRSPRKTEPAIKIENGEIPPY